MVSGASHRISLWLAIVSSLGLMVLPAGIPPLTSTSLRPRAPHHGPLFESIPPALSGVSLVHDFPTNTPLTLMQEQGSGCGICAGDVDGDGLPDLLISNYNRGCRLYRNLGDWRFLDVTDRAGVRTGNQWCGGVTMVDIDNDGDLDIYICCLNSPNLLYINRGDGVFTEQAADYGLAWVGASVMAAFGDYDRDGRLDLYLLTHRNPYSGDAKLPRDTRDAAARGILQRSARGGVEVAPRFRELFEIIEKGEGRIELSIAGQADQLFHQLPNGRFTNVTLQAGISGNDIGLGVSWWDYDGDGWPDIYVANDHKTPDRLWRNRGDGTFVESASLALPHVPHSSMGTDVGDINNDGRIDLLATDMAGSTRSRRMLMDQDLDNNRWFLERSSPRQLPRNALFLATGTERVLEVARMAGLYATDWTWSPKFGDYDNDGWLDLFIANGMSRDYLNGDLLAQLKQSGSPGWRQRPVLKETNLAFRNLGQLRFSPAEVEWGLNQSTASFGAALADFDQDGDLDLAVMNFGEPVSLYRNGESVNHRLILRLQGTRSNRWGVGAVAVAETAQGRQSRTVSLTSGFMSANEPLLHFGLGAQTNLPRLTVVWPSGARQHFENLAADRSYTVVESDLPPPPAPVIPPVPWFRPATNVGDFLHTPRPSDDFSREALLPWKLSQRGPALAIGDIDGDGDEDFYMGGAAGLAGVLGLQQADGTFRSKRLPVFEADREFGDSGVLFFDADGDGDLDLYVASGEVEHDPGSRYRRDRLYINNGRSEFSRAPMEALPDGWSAGGVVCAADFDRDGDLDLLVGGGSIPGQYPLPARTRLLRNDRGTFSDVTDSVLPGLNAHGVITGAVWSDANGDGWLDLVVTCEWGVVKLFLNREGRFEDATIPAGFGSHAGLWQSVIGCDVDGDGDVDYITGNHGLNSGYRASAQDPLWLYRGDFEDTGQTNLLVVLSERGVLYPERGRRALMSAFVRLAENHPTFQSLAGATLTNLFSREALARAFKVHVNSLESGVWLNDGHAHFTFVALPALAQVSPSLGLVSLDWDGDGHPDLGASQNVFAMNMEAGPQDGGMGLLLRGLGGGRFDALYPGASGFAVPGDGRGIGILDMNQDGLPDLLVGVYGGKLQAFENRAADRSPSLTAFGIRLRGSAGNPFAIGSRIVVSFKDGSRRLAEVYAGGNGFTQSGEIQYFPHRSEVPPIRVDVRWTDGRATVVPLANPARIITISAGN